MNGTTFTMDLTGNSVGLTQFVTPVTTTNWDNRELGKDNGTTDGGGDFLGALDAKTDVTVLVTDSDNSLEYKLKIFWKSKKALKLFGSIYDLE